MKIACIILASGKSERFNKSKSKLFYKIYGTPIIEYTLKNISKFINKNSIYITIPKNITKKEKKLLLKYTSNLLITGANTRFESAKNAIVELNNDEYDYIMMHDAARPIVPEKLIKGLLNSMRTNLYDCAIPMSKVEDALRKNNKSIERNHYTTYQTPQIFNLKLYKNYISKIRNYPDDDLGVIETKKNLKIKFIESSKENIKITKVSDLIIFKKLISNKFKVGNGFDLHKLKKGPYLSLAGLKIKSKFMAIGHSDGDVVIHSIIDSLLGAIRKQDIGTYFPASEKYKNINSNLIFEEISRKLKFRNLIIDNLDCTIICQAVRLDKFKSKIRGNIANLLNTNSNRINVKAKTADKIGSIGKSKAIACWTTVKLIHL